jgi:capsular exopolysaccharide synthesis family protein
MPSTESLQAAVTSQGQEYFRPLLDRLRLAPGGQGALRTLGVTSCYSGEGVSTIAAQLALAAALEGDKRVLVVDANSTRPALHRIFDVASGPGWTDLVQASVDLSAAAQPSEIPNLSVLAAGDSSSAAEASRLSRAVGEVQADFDLVVFDLPAAAEGSNADRLAALVDGVLLVVESERVRWQVAQRTKERLLRCDARLLGAVLNKRQKHVPGWLYRTL